MVEHLYRVDMGPNFKASNIFHADRLRRAPDDPLPRQRNNEPEPEVVDGNIEYEVEKILSSRVSRDKLQYRASWLGCDPDETWYDAENFKNAPHRLR